MKVLIIEDEHLAAEKLQNDLKKIEPEIEFLKVIQSVEGALKWLKENPAPDLVFCDIHLSDGLSFDIFKYGTVTSPVIFTTAYDHYAIRAFEVNSVSYLLKPIQPEKLKDALEKYKKLNKEKQPGQTREFDRLVDIIQRGSSQFKTRFLVKVGHKIKSVSTSKIAYFYSRDKLNYLITKNDEKLPIDHTLEEVEKMLDPKCFFRLNRQFITQIDAIKEVHPHFKGRMKIDLQPGIDEEIVVSSEKTPAFKQWLDQ
ncbi:MAG: LytTR family DNA-binding domain-containing protein [Bacteroidota bacterium]